MQILSIMPSVDKKHNYCGMNVKVENLVVTMPLTLINQGRDLLASITPSGRGPERTFLGNRD